MPGESGGASRAEEYRGRRSIEGGGASRAEEHREGRSIERAGAWVFASRCMDRVMEEEGLYELRQDAVLLQYGCTE